MLWYACKIFIICSWFLIKNTLSNSFNVLSEKMLLACPSSVKFWFWIEYIEFTKGLDIFVTLSDSLFIEFSVLLNLFDWYIFVSLWFLITNYKVLFFILDLNKRIFSLVLVVLYQDNLIELILSVVPSLASFLLNLEEILLALFFLLW